MTLPEFIYQHRYLLLQLLLSGALYAVFLAVWRWKWVEAFHMYEAGVPILWALLTLIILSQKFDVQTSALLFVSFTASAIGPTLYSISFNALSRKKARRRSGG